MNKTLKENRNKILQDIANPDNVVLSQSPRYPGADKLEKIFKLADKNTPNANNTTMFEMRFVLPGIVQYAIVLPNKPVISRIVNKNAKWHRPTVKVMLEIYDSLLNKRLHQQIADYQTIK